jgi:hypothetical protein
MAQNGMVVVAVEDTSGESVATAAEYLKEERGAARGVALVGSSPFWSKSLRQQASNVSYFGSSQRDPTAFLSFLETCATRHLAEPLLASVLKNSFTLFSVPG